MKVKRKWTIIDSLEHAQLGDDYKNIKTDLNKDSYNDLILLGKDGYKRIVFIFDTKKKIIEHSKGYDRLRDKEEK